MSAKLFGQVWGLELKHDEQDVLLALADSADDNGHRCWPSVGFLSWKTGWSERQVQRALRRLECLRLICGVGSMKGGATTPIYEIHLENGTPKAPWVNMRGRRERGDTQSPVPAKVVAPVTPGVTVQTDRGDCADPEGCQGEPKGVTTQSPDPSGDPGGDPSVEPSVIRESNPHSPLLRKGAGDRPEKIVPRRFRKHDRVPVGAYVHEPRVGSFAWERQQAAAAALQEGSP